MGVGGVFVAALLVGLLAYLDVFDASDVVRPRVRAMLVATIAPLLLTFGAIVLFKSLQVV
jgi:fumarate reductase subunit D